LGDLDKSLKWAEEHGFSSISITVPVGSRFLDLRDIIENPSKYLDIMSRYKVKISAIGFYGNPIDADSSRRREHSKHMMNIVRAAHKLELPVVTGWIGKYPGTVDDNIREMRKVWPDIIKLAEDYGIKIAIENCPGNIMYRPDIWRRVFEEFNTEILGLEFDPSHLICQLIDVIGIADEFGDKIYHIHAKDAEIDWRRVSDLGITVGGWCPHRLPGFGELDWAAFFSVLKKHKYDYAVSIEHEDPYFEYEEGLIIAKKFLERFIV